MSENNFVKLAQINVNDKIEKKGNLSYLSWAWAVDQLLRSDPAAHWYYLDPERFGETMMVRCAVTAFGKEMTAHLPVMDHKNKPIANPDAFQVNTAMQRCLVKAIALHGLGLYIYAGEDVPQFADGTEFGAHKIPATVGAWEAMEPDMQTFLNDIAANVKALLGRGKDADAYDELEAAKLEHEAKNAIWTRFDSKERSALKRVGESRKPTKEAA